MNERYPLRYADHTVGFVEVTKHGLFYKIKSRFSIEEAGEFHLAVDCSGSVTDLGLCVQYGSVLGVERYLPISRVGEGQLRFYVRPKCSNTVFMQVSDDRPFLQLQRLLASRFTIRSGEKGVLLKDSSG